jgi:hypothetical protein
LVQLQVESDRRDLMRTEAEPEEGEVHGRRLPAGEYELKHELIQGLDLGSTQDARSLIRSSDPEDALRSLLIADETARLILVHCGNVRNHKQTKLTYIEFQNFIDQARRTGLACSVRLVWRAAV